MNIVDSAAIVVCVVRVEEVESTVELQKGVVDEFAVAVVNCDCTSFDRINEMRQSNKLWRVKWYKKNMIVGINT